jgi:hypothetical protein
MDSILKINQSVDIEPSAKSLNEILGFSEKSTVTHCIGFDIQNITTTMTAKIFAFAVLSALTANEVKLVDIELVLGRRAVITFMVPIYVKVSTTSHSIKYAIQSVLRRIKED